MERSELEKESREQYIREHTKPRKPRIPFVLSFLLFSWFISLIGGCYSWWFNGKFQDAQIMLLTSVSLVLGAIADAMIRSQWRRLLTR